jgi:hypothetical protein
MHMTGGTSHSHHGNFLNKLCILDIYNQNTLIWNINTGKTTFNNVILKFITIANRAHKLIAYLHQILGRLFRRNQKTNYCWQELWWSFVQSSQHVLAHLCSQCIF